MVGPTLYIFYFFISLCGGIKVGKTLKLSSGYDIPVVGLGTNSIEKEKFDNAIASALETGYRHFDVFLNYEVLMGQALKKWFDQGGKREDLFITTKLPAFANRPEKVEKYLNHSLESLGLDYLDMYIISMPFATIVGDNFSPLKENGLQLLEQNYTVDHVAVWKEMEKQVKNGRVKSIGLSNFNQTQVLNIYDSAEIKPSNLQIESHAYFQQKKLREFCKQKNIVVTAYAPLGSIHRRKLFYAGTEKNLTPLTENTIVKELAQKYKKSPAQILLRLSVQNGMVVIPKSSNYARQKENIEIFDFELSTEDVEKIESLEVGEIRRVFDFLKNFKDLEKNPQYPFRESAN